MKSTTMAEKAAATRATEMIFPKELRLYEDLYSEKFLSRTNRFFLSVMKGDFLGKWLFRMTENMAPGVYGGVISRTRYMDDVLESAVAEGFDAVVNLGGGYDTKCLRFNMENVKYFHVDQTEVIEKFKSLMSELESGIPPNVNFVAVDFDRQNLEAELEKAGFDKTKKALFLWEGVTQYITREAVSSLLRFISSVAKDSQVVFTYVLRSVIDSPEAFPEYKGLMKQFKLFDVEWITGFEQKEVREFLLEHGLELIEDVGADEYRKRYFDSINRDVEIMRIERIAYAKVV